MCMVSKYMCVYLCIPYSRFLLWVKTFANLVLLWQFVKAFFFFFFFLFLKIFLEGKDKKKAQQKRVCTH